MTRVKICGITDLEDALMCAKFGADAIGFNFFDGSKRFIKPNEAGSIIEQLSDQIIKFGVFVNATVDEILDTVRITRINVIQLHGDESPDFVSRLRSEAGTPIVKAVRVSDRFDISSLSAFMVEAFLLDSYSAGQFGGTGTRFNWDKAISVVELGSPTYLAGGLVPENVAEAIRIVRPFAVDVASGVESSPGIKDPAKLEAFISNAKQA
jgi:phosphoribosylanthranilate isomerase